MAAMAAHSFEPDRALATSWPPVSRSFDTLAAKCELHATQTTQGALWPLPAGHGLS